MRHAALPMLALMLAAGLAACATPAPSGTSGPSAPADAGVTTPAPSSDTCGASMYAELIGKPIDGSGVPGPSRLVRHILPDTRVTMDYIGQRMNIEADAAGVIRKINCG
jgi:hypothetical protein